MDDIILLIGNGRETKPQLVRSLENEGVDIRVAVNGRQGLQIAAGAHFSVIVTETALPDISSIELVGAIREWSDVPIIAVSHRAHIPGTVPLLEAGVDSHLVQPFSDQELKARLHVAFRHHRRQPLDPGPILRVGSLQVNLIDRTVTVQGEAIELAPLEYRFFAELARKAGRIVTHESLQTRLWGRITVQNRATLRVYANYLRKKLNRPEIDVSLETVNGVGYRLLLPD